MRTRTGIVGATAVVALLLGRAAAVAGVQEGQPAPNFTKNQLDFPGFGQVTPRSLGDYAGKVVFLFVLGYS